MGQSINSSSWWWFTDPGPFQLFGSTITVGGWKGGKINEKLLLSDFRDQGLGSELCYFCAPSICQKWRQVAGKCAPMCSVTFAGNPLTSAEKHMSWSDLGRPGEKLSLWRQPGRKVPEGRVGGLVIHGGPNDRGRGCFVNVCWMQEQVYIISFL